MKKIIRSILLGVFFTIPLVSVAAKPVFLIQALNKVSNFIYPGQTLSVSYQITNNTPFSLNENGVVNLPRGVSQAGGTCGTVFYLASGASCTVNLQIVADELATDIKGGPVVCHKPNQRIYCSQATAENALNIVRGTTGAISVLPNTLNLIIDGEAQLVTINNLSTTTDVENLQATIPGTSAITIDPVNTTCTSTLTIGSSCQFSFLPGNQTETNTPITIAGSNTTAPVIVRVNVAPVIITASPSSRTFTVGGTGSITVTNTSATVPVNDLQVTFPSGSNLSVDPSSTCVLGDSLAPASSCVFAFAASAPEFESIVNISGINSNTAQVTVTAQSAAPVISVSNPDQGERIINVGSATPLVLTILNSATSPLATTLSVTIPPSWSSSDVTATLDAECTNLQPGSTCTLSLTSTAPYMPDTLSISGTNGANTATTSLATRMNGGIVFYVAGTSPSATVKVSQEADSSTGIQWGNLNVNPSAYSTSDGQTNTNAIVSTPGLAPTAAGICTSSTSGGYSDWYLPAICELGYKNTVQFSGDAGCGTTTPNVYGTLFLQGFGNFNYDSVYWSSSQTGGSNFAWYQLFDGRQFGGSFDNGYQVRCIRTFTN